ncbi:MAG: hypothetical protein KF852_14910 [Saprospiraceae bacterium]|nr:hypothetical protein [Saprospiraceae bacterium]
MKAMFLAMFLLLYPNQTELASIEVDYNGDLAKYYKLINAAEMLIVDSLYQEAFTLYGAAFDINNKPFCMDIYNYSILCEELGKDDLAKDLKARLESFLVVKDGNYKDSTLLNEDQIFLLKVLSEDQRDRFEAAKTTKFIYEGASGQTLRAKDSLRYIKFMQRYGDSGFPHEEIAGVSTLDGYSRFLNVVISHWKSNGFSIDTMLLKSLHNGAIYMEDAAFLLDNGALYGQSLAYTKMGDTINSYLNINLEKVRFFDSYRSMLYMESYCDYIRKYEFQLTPRGNKFRLIRMSHALLKFE